MIEFKNVSLKQQNQEILKDFNLHIKNHQRLVIVGASGSGKTTLLRLIAGFITPDSGEIFIDNKIVSKDKKILLPPHKREVGMVFQDLALWTHMSVEQNIEFGLKIQKMPKKQRREKVTEFLHLVGLDDYGKKRVDQLSGGEQQRVALARSLVLSPKILLMDEPLSSLDEELNLKLRAEIVRLQKELGFTLVYVTHNLAEAEEIGEKILSLS
jgi:ABC-type sugar transport system ATPase subunit